MMGEIVHADTEAAQRVKTLPTMKDLMVSEFPEEDESDNDYDEAAEEEEDDEMANPDELPKEAPEAEQLDEIEDDEDDLDDELDKEEVSALVQDADRFLGSRRVLRSGPAGAHRNTSLLDNIADSDDDEDEDYHAAEHDEEEGDEEDDEEEEEEENAEEAEADESAEHHEDMDEDVEEGEVKDIVINAAHIGSLPTKDAIKLRHGKEIAPATAEMMNLTTRLEELLQNL